MACIAVFVVTVVVVAGIVGSGDVARLLHGVTGSSKILIRRHDAVVV